MASPGAWTDLHLLADRPGLPALGLASALLLSLCLVLLVFRSRSQNAPADMKGLAANSVANGHLNGNAPAKPAIRILFGTQTGTAERFAKQLRSALLLRYGDATDYLIEDIESYSGPEQLPKEQAVIFLMATYGDGEPTDNAADFYGWLTKAADNANNGIGDDALLKGLTYGVFGLGNKQYEHFASVGKVIHRALGALGGTPICRRGDGDDDDDIDADFEAWQADLLLGLDVSPVVSVPKDGDELVEQLQAAMSPEAVPTYDVEVLSGGGAGDSLQDSAEDLVPAMQRSISKQTVSKRFISKRTVSKRFVSGKGNGSGADSRNPFEARLIARRELHQPGSERSCLHAELDLGSSQLQYDTGDHLTVFPENSEETVAAAAAVLGQPLDMVFSLALPPGNPQQLSPPFEGSITLRMALARHADVLAPVYRGALDALAAFATDDKQAARLRHLASPEGKADFQAWAVAPGRSLLEAMQEFGSARPPLGAFFGAVAMPLQPRFYSISSSPKAHPRAVHITCSVIRETKDTGRIHNGVASTWLARLPIGAKVPVFVRRSAFKLPVAMSTPLVMIGPGTGLAPFRGFLQEREAAAKSGQALGPALLFFGCRHSKHDFIYEAELRDHEASGTLSRLEVAFSRDGPAKQYVQHRMAALAGEVWRHIEANGGSVFVCGDAKHMARDVNRALITLIATQKPCSEAGAEVYLQQLTDAGRYQRDVW